MIGEQKVDVHLYDLLHEAKEILDHTLKSLLLTILLVLLATLTDYLLLLLGLAKLGDEPSNQVDVGF